MSKKIITLPKGLNAPLGRFFNSSEFDCKCKNPSCTITRISLYTLLKAIELRDRWGALRVTSGYRCPSHNAAVGGSPNSQHMKGTAIDVIPLTTPLDEFKKALFKDHRDIPGLGLNYTSFVHIDFREGQKSRW